MAIIASDNSGDDFKPIPEGRHPAICDMVVDLGKQETNFGVKHQVYLRWQIPGERLKYERDGAWIDKPMAIGRTFTLSLSDKSNLRPLLEDWRDKPFTPAELRAFDITAVAGAPCVLKIRHNVKDGKTFADIRTVEKLEGPKPPIDGEVIIYDADHLDNFDKLRPWLQDKIKAAVEASESKPKQSRGPAFDDDLDDDVPF